VNFPKLPSEYNAVIKVAKGLLAIAAQAMPDTYYATDSRCQAARRLLNTLGKLPRKERRFLPELRDGAVR
jgi:hypothetical protein